MRQTNKQGQKRLYEAKNNEEHSFKILRSGFVLFQVTLYLVVTFPDLIQL